ncbi:SPOR domain-containing protein [Luteimonas aquatica]|uniref:SPOR domain-containing protein n=1 Tax=Luteimonas aquatica TaxID=450364 RepID=UPI001F5AD621|nr:SPOR domain-containing protein [Luteimonas aquatica]
MAARRGKSQARRNTGNSGGLPGWAWLVLGVVLTLIVVLMAPKWLKSDGGDGFIRPKPNPDAQPAAASGGEESVVQDADTPAPAANAGAKPAPASTPEEDKQQYDFYTLLPGQEVAMSDAELAATSRAEEERQRKLAQQQQKQQPAQAPAASGTTPGTAGSLPAQVSEQPERPTVAATPATGGSTAPASPAATTASAAAQPQARYILQAGAFGASGDAEALKARIALLGLNARVESAAIGGKTVYRVRMGPYGTATELADAKNKLGNGGLPAMAIKAR